MESGPAVDPGRVADGTPVLAALVIQVMSCWWQVLRASWAPWTARCMSSHVWPTDWASCACESCCLKVSFYCNILSLSVSTLCRSHSRSFTVLRHTLWFSIARFHRCVYNSNFFPPAMSPRGLTLGSPHEPTAHRRFLESLSSQIHQVFT